MIPVGDRRAAHAASGRRAGERADKRIFFLYALYKRKLCTINLAETERESNGNGNGNDNCSDNAKDTNQKAAAAKLQNKQKLRCGGSCCISSVNLFLNSSN